MFSKTNKIKKSFIGAIAMSLILLMGSAFGFLLETKIGQITQPTSTETWANHIQKPSGSGTSADDPWRINSAENLAYLINNIGNAEYYIHLETNIDLNSYEWEPIKVSNKDARVNFYGNNFTIKGLTINRPWGTNCGFFDVFSWDFNSSLNMRDTIFSNVDIRSANSAVVTNYARAGTISNCHIISGSVIGDANTGAFATMFWGTIKNCTNNAKVFSRTDAAGGIASYVTTIENCINTGDVTGGGDYIDSNYTIGTIGGICANGNVYNCLNTGSVTSFGKAYVGGIVGIGNVTNSGFYGEISVRSTPLALGSIVGSTNGNIENSFGVATINYEPDEVADTSVVNQYGAPKKTNNLKNIYSQSKVYTSDSKTKDIRKYCGDDFSSFAYSPSINGGYPFPKELFAVGQFIECDTLSYLKSYGFSS